MIVMEKDFIKNVLEVETNAFNATNRYIVKAMYNVFDDTGCADIEHETLEDFTMSWNDLSKMGGECVLNEHLKEKYNLDI